jgi:hypothetical protein
VRDAGHDRALARELELHRDLLRLAAQRAHPEAGEVGHDDRGDEREDRDHREDLDQREATLMPGHG